MSVFGSAFLHWDVQDGVAWLTIDRPATKNAMSLEMYRGIGRAVQAADADDDIGVVVITGVGDSFCVGGGLTAGVLFEDPESWPGMGFVPGSDGRVRELEPGEAPVDIERDVAPFDTIIAARTTIIASVNGLCAGGGFVIALAADLTIAATGATFWIPELLHGFVEPWVPVLLPARVGLERAKNLMFTAQRFGGQQAADWGLVSEAVPDADLRDRTQKLVGRVLRTAPVARSIYKAQANRHLVERDLDAVRAATSETEKREGLSAFAEQRPPNWARPGHGGLSGR